MLKNLITGAAFLCIAAEGLAQKVEDGAPVNITVSPAVSMPGRAVKINGSTLVGKSALEVTIVIKAPGGAVDSLKLKTGNEAKFSGSYAKTTAQGWYTFTAITADRQNKATDSLYVSTGQKFIMALAKKQLRLSIMAYDAAQLAGKKAAELPPSAGTAKFNEKNEELKKQVSDMRRKIDDNIMALSKLTEEIGDVPKAVEKAGPYYDEMEKMNEEMDTKISNLQQMLDISRDKATQCDNLNNLAELISFISLCYDFEGKFIQICLNLASDKVLPGTVDRMTWNGDANEVETKKFKINESQKAMTAVAQGYKSFWDFMKKGFIYDLGQYITKTMYNEVCTELKGPTKTSFRAEFDADGPGSLYWTYDVALQGTLTLRYDKTADMSKAVAVTGEFEGIVSGYKFWEDFEKVEKLPKSLVLYKRIRISPKVIDAGAIGNDLGMIARNMIPGSYRVKVKGEIVKNKLTLEVAGSGWDVLGDAKREDNKLYVIAVSPIVPIPLIKRFDFPIASPKVIYFRGFNGKKEFDVKQEKDKVTVVNKFHTDTELSNGSVMLKTDVDIKLSN